jgi:hypothetical protein
VELEGEESFAEVDLDENRVLCSDGVFVNLPQGLFLRDTEYVMDNCNAFSDTRGRIKRINYRIHIQETADLHFYTLGLRFAECKGWNAFETSEDAADVIKHLGALIMGRVKAGHRLTHQIDVDYPQPLKTRPCAFRFRSIICYHGRMLYYQDVTIKND